MSIGAEGDTYNDHTIRRHGKMAEVISNSSFAHPSAVQSADQPFQSLVNTVGGLGKTLEGVSGWQVFFTIVLLSITYDQGLYSPG